jgi:uncharacterized protein YkwD
VPSRGPSPVLLLCALLLACLAPVGVVVATGLASSPIDGDGVETADGESGDGEGDGAPDALRYGGEGSDARRSLNRVDDRASSTTIAPTTTEAPSTSASSTLPATTAPPATAPPTSPPTAPPAPPPPASATDQVVSLVNQARAAAGCGPVTVNGALTAAAQAHSDDMGVNGYFSHTSRDGRTFDQRIRAAGYGGGYVGENIAQGQRSARAVHDAWMASAGHRRNILDCGFTAIGVGLHAATWTWTQDFGG